MKSSQISGIVGVLGSILMTIALFLPFAVSNRLVELDGDPKIYFWIWGYWNTYAESGYNAPFGAFLGFIILIIAIILFIKSYMLASNKTESRNPALFFILPIIAIFLMFMWIHFIEIFVVYGVRALSYPYGYMEDFWYYFDWGSGIYILIFGSAIIMVAGLFLWVSK